MSVYYLRRKVMYCKKCGFEVTDNSIKKCPKCGAKVNGLPTWAIVLISQLSLLC